MKLAGDATPTPNSLASFLGLKLRPVSFGRCGLFGQEIAHSDTVPWSMQQYQIARSGCAYALLRMGWLRYVSPHDLAVALFGVSSADTQASDDAQALAPVTYIGAAKRLRRATRGGTPVVGG
jgi:hypothetical protein